MPTARQQAIIDNEGLAQAAAFDLNTEILPQLVAAQRGAGASGDALASLQEQNAAASLAANVAKNKTATITDYERTAETKRSNIAGEQLQQADITLRDTISQRNTQVQNSRITLDDVISQRDNSTRLTIQELINSTQLSIQGMRDANAISLQDSRNENAILLEGLSAANDLTLAELQGSIGENLANINNAADITQAQIGADATTAAAQIRADSANYATDANSANAQLAADNALAIAEMESSVARQQIAQDALNPYNNMIVSGYYNDFMSPAPTQNNQQQNNQPQNNQQQAVNYG